jgi:DNA-binding NtrC family response regulator
MLLEDAIAAEARRIEEALEATKKADFDLAILDANLNGPPVSPVADASSPAAHHSSLPRAMASCPSPIATALKKPFHRDGLKRMLQNALDRGSR